MTGRKAVDGPFDRIATLNEKLHFCEDFAASGPVDRAHEPARIEGPLRGKAVGLKSNIRVAGQAWTAGIGARVSRIAERDAPLVTALRGAGAVILSRLAMDEGALGAATDNPHFGRCENPAWPGHSAGGSSGGSAAAVAADAVDAALGSDTMGSVRIPAAYCGVYGLKLGKGTLGMEGIVPLAPSFDAPGIFARDPMMLGAVLDVLAPANDRVPGIGGWVAPDAAALGACHPVVAAFQARCAAVLYDLLGAPGAFPALDYAALRGDVFLQTEVEAVASLGGEAGLSPGLRKLLDYGRRVTPKALAAARDRTQAAGLCLTEALGRDRVLLLPTVAQPAFAQGARPPVGQADFTALANLAGCPALAIPAPVRDADKESDPETSTAPPVSVQIVGPHGSERALIALAERMRRAP